MADFRIKVIIPYDVVSFFDGGFSARICVSSAMSTIKDVQNHVSEYFGICDSFYFTLRGDFLHPMENVKVLKFGDVVTINKGSFGKYLEKRKTTLESIKEVYRFVKNLKANLTEYIAWYLFESRWLPEPVCTRKNDELSPNSTSSAEADEICCSQPANDHVIVPIQTRTDQKLEKKHLTKVEALIEEIKNNEQQFSVYY